MEQMKDLSKAEVREYQEKAPNVEKTNDVIVYLKEFAEKVGQDIGKMEHKLSELEQRIKKIRNVKVSNDNQIPDLSPVLKGQSVSFRWKATTTANYTGDVIPPTVLPNVYSQYPDYQHLRTLMPVFSLQNETAINIRRETNRIGGAAVKPEGSAAGSTDFNIASVVVPVRVIQAYTDVTEEALGNSNLIKTYISSELVSEVLRAEDTYILSNTDGTGIKDLAQSSTVLPATSVPNATHVDVLLSCVATLGSQGFQADLILISYDSFLKLLTDKDTTQNYLLPQWLANNGLALRIGNARVVPHPSVPADSFIAGDFKRGAMAGVSPEFEVRVYEQNADNAIKGVYTILVKGRVAPLVLRPGAFISDTFSAAITQITV